MKYVSMYYCYLHKLFIAYGAKLEKNTCVLCGYLFYNQRIVSTLHSMNEDLEDILLLVTGYGSITCLKILILQTIHFFGPKKPTNCHCLHFLKV